VGRFGSFEPAADLGKEISVRGFFAIIIKDIRVRFCSPMELVFFILLPVVFTVVLSGVSLRSSGNVKNVPLILLQDTVRSEQTRAFRALLDTMPGARIRNVTDPTALISSSEPDLLISLTPVADPVMGLPFTAGFRLSPWRGSAGATAQSVAAWLQAARNGTRPVAPAVADEEAPAEATAVAATDAPGTAAISNAGQIITWVLMPLLGIGVGFLTERRRGTMRRVWTTPIPRTLVSAASIVAEVLGALVQIGLLIGFGTIVLGLRWFSHPLELIGLCVAFCVAGASLGALLGTVCRTPRQASSLGLALGLVMAVFGGCWYPSALFPASLRSITRLDPAGWAMKGFLAVLSPEAGAGQAVWSMAMLLGFGVAVFFLSVLASRRRHASVAA
jgi:ABC-2 type transport system permease protein